MPRDRVCRLRLSPEACWRGDRPGRCRGRYSGRCNIERNRSSGGRDGCRVRRVCSNFYRRGMRPEGNLLG